MKKPFFVFMISIMFFNSICMIADSQLIEDQIQEKELENIENSRNYRFI